MKCRYFSRCGGCQYNSTDYSDQLEAKRNKVKRILRTVPEVFASKPFNYRNRMDFVVQDSKIGLRQKNRWDEIVDVERCNIADEKINKALSDVRKHKLPLQVRGLLIRCTADETAVSYVVDDFIDVPLEVADNVLMTKVDPESNRTSSSDYRILKGNDMLKEELCGKQFLYSVQGFFQINMEVAEKMHGYVSRAIGTRKEAHLIDLFGGVGAFGIINSTGFSKTTIIESDKASIDAAQKNIELNQAVDTVAVHMDAVKLPKLEPEGPLYVIADPPRAGLHHSTISYLKRVRPKMVVYVSCNPNQLKKDIKVLGYSLKDLALFDMFPQTDHVEVVAVLTPQAPEDI